MAVKLDLFSALRPVRISTEAYDRPGRSEVSWAEPDLSHFPDIAARLVIESPSFGWPFPALADARVDRAGMFDRHDLELENQGGNGSTKSAFSSEPILSSAMKDRPFRPIRLISARSVLVMQLTRSGERNVCSGKNTIRGLHPDSISDQMK
jgi:hypothetical protein